MNLLMFTQTSVLRGDLTITAMLSNFIDPVQVTFVILLIHRIKR